jgi:hypothetical protein
MYFATRQNIVHFTNMLTYHPASLECISSVSNDASASRYVIEDVTFCVMAAHSGTRILTLIVHASFVWWAVCRKEALWSTSDVWISEIFRKASTGASLIAFFTDSIRSTWWGIARIENINLLRGWQIRRLQPTSRERISDVSIKTIAISLMIGRLNKEDVKIIRRKSLRKIRSLVSKIRTLQ